MPPSDDAPPSPGDRFEALATGVVVLVAAALALGPRAIAAVGPHATRAECDALLDRYVEHLAFVDGEKRRAIVEERRSAARRLAVDDLDFQRCPDVVTQAQAACARDAPDADAFERCLE